MNEDGSAVLALWDALVPKLRQIIREETRSAVRAKKMNIQSIDTTAQTVTVYEGANPGVTITVPYRKESGVGSLSAGQSVIIEWDYDDLSTATASTPGQGWSANTVDLPLVTQMLTPKVTTVDNSETNGNGNAPLGMSTSSVSVLGCRTTSTNQYLCIPFVSAAGDWYVRVVDNTGARVVNTNVGTITVYYLTTA